MKGLYRIRIMNLTVNSPLCSDLGERRNRVRSELSFISLTYLVKEYYSLGAKPRGERARLVERVDQE